MFFLPIVIYQNKETQESKCNQSELFFHLFLVILSILLKTRIANIPKFLWLLLWYRFIHYSIFFSFKTQTLVETNSDQFHSVLCLYTFKKYILLLHPKLKHSNVDICATSHLEKLNFETVFRSYYKPYFNLLLPPPNVRNYGKLWKKMLYFHFVL